MRHIAIFCVLLISLSAFGRGRSSGSRSGSRSSRSHSSRSYSTRSHSSRSHSSRSSTTSHSKPQHVGSYTRKGMVVHSYNRAHAGTAPKRYPATARHTPSAKHHAAPASHPRSVARPAHTQRDSHGIKRSEAAKDAFKHSHPCPSTGKSSGACPGYVIDHVRPLSKGGADAPSNMQWQTSEAAKAKDKWERK